MTHLYNATHMYNPVSFSVYTMCGAYVYPSMEVVHDETEIGRVTCRKCLHVRRWRYPVPNDVDVPASRDHE